MTNIQNISSLAAHCDEMGHVTPHNVCVPQLTSVELELLENRTASSDTWSCPRLSHMANICCCLLCMSDYVALTTFTLAGVFELGHPTSLMGDETNTLQATQQDLEQNSNWVQSLGYSTVWTSKFCKHGMEESRIVCRWKAPWAPGPLTISFPLESNHLHMQPAVHHAIPSPSLAPVGESGLHMFPWELPTRCWIWWNQIATERFMNGIARITPHTIGFSCSEPLQNETSAMLLISEWYSLFVHPKPWPSPPPWPSFVPFVFTYFPPLAIKLNVQAEELKLRFSPTRGPF